MAEMKEVCDELSMNSVLYDIVMLERSLGKLKELLPNWVQAAGNTIEMKHKMIIGGKVYHALFADRQICWKRQIRACIPFSRRKFVQFWCRRAF